MKKNIIFLCVLVFSFLNTTLTWTATVTHGPIVGAVTTNSARIAVRTNGTALVNFELSIDSAFSTLASTDQTTAEASNNFFAICEINGLMPNMRYYYRTVLDQATQAEVRSFKTFIESGTESTFTFSFGSGQQASHDPGSMKGDIFPVMAEEMPQFFLQIGDWSYPDLAYEPTAPPEDFYFALDYDRVLATYEFKYDPTFPLDELLAVTAVDYLYDDHDMVSDNSDRTYPGIENSLKGYDVAFPHYPLANGENGIWHKFSCGEADFFMIDTRTQRDPNENTLNELSNGTLQYVFKQDHLMLSGDATISGELQIDWLLRELRESTATWKFLVSTVAFNPAERSTVELALLLQGTPLDPLDVPGQGFMSTADIAIAFTDRWGGFPATIQKILRSVSDEGIENVIVLSGDSHNTAIDDGANSFFPELMGGGLDRSNSEEVAMEASFGIPLWNQGGQYYELGNFKNAYGKVTVFGSDSVLLEAVDEDKFLIADYTVKPGYTVETVGLAAAPQGQDLFGEVEVGQSSVLPIIIMATGCDTLLINSVSFTGTGYSTFFPPKVIPPGQAKRIGVAFSPKEARVYQEAIILETNSPAGTVTLPLVGIGVHPVGVNTNDTKQPFVYDLKQNYPNPFNATTKIEYSLQERTDVQISIFNSSGKLVRKVDYEKQSKGVHSIVWDGTDENENSVASGIYFVHIKTENFSAVRKMILLK
jgi:alkaline phosphatase D